MIREFLRFPSNSHQGLSFFLSQSSCRQMFRSFFARLRTQSCWEGELEARREDAIYSVSFISSANGLVNVSTPVVGGARATRRYHSFSFISSANRLVEIITTRSWGAREKVTEKWAEVELWKIPDAFLLYRQFCKDLYSESASVRRSVSDGESGSGSSDSSGVWKKLLYILTALFA